MSVVTVGGVTARRPLNLTSLAASPIMPRTAGHNVGLDRAGYWTPNEVDFYMDSTTPSTNILNTQAGFFIQSLKG